MVIDRHRTTASKWKLRLWCQVIALVAAVLACTPAATAQDNNGGRGGQPTEGEVARTLPTFPTTPPTTTAVAAGEAPELDGEVLGDPVWAAVPPVTAFWQATPDELSPSTEKTEVRIIYTADTMFFGVICYDRDPSSIIVSDSRRDASLNETDSFQIILDTYLDRQNGFVFGTNPAGIQYDGQVTREGAGGGQIAAGAQVQQGSGGGFNVNWDGQWEVATNISEIGWSAEFAIPLRTLRYRSTETQTWGANFQRNIRRRNERAYWAPLTRQFNLYRLSLAGSIADLKVPDPRNLKLIPYLLGQARHRGGDTDQTNWLGDWGSDLKYSVTPSLTLDVTYNTDFAQVEVDEQQINLDRFNLFFPEKRPFFLENAGLFSVGRSGQEELFFSRRIGIGPRGEIVPILAGARLSGKIARTNVGFLNMQADDLSGVTHGNNFTVARVSREMPNRSAIGAIFVNRQGTGDAAPEEDYNRTFGFDGRWGFGEYGRVEGHLAGTSTPGLSGSNHATRIQVGRNSPNLDVSAEYREVGENFNPEVGFLRRTPGYRAMELRFFNRLRHDYPFGILELRPHISVRSWWNLDGFQQTGLVHFDNHVEWRAGHQFESALNLTTEGVEEAFEISPGVIVPAGTYDNKETNLIFWTNRGAWISFITEATIGGFFGGDRKRVTPGVSLRLGETFNTELSWEHNNIDLPGGSFETNLAQARFSYSFNPSTALQALVQYNDRADIWSLNLRFSWLESGNNGLFIVFNSTRQVGSFSAVEPNRSLIIKYSRVFELLN